MSKHYIRFLIGACASIALAVFTYHASSAAEPGPSKGRIPPDARTENGQLDVEKVPEYVLALARDGSAAGYVRKEDLFGTARTQIKARSLVNPPIPVWDDSLIRVVGHMIAGRGFVPNGVRVEDVPAFKTSRADSP